MDFSDLERLFPSFAQIASVLWWIWKDRNYSIFRQSSLNPLNTLFKASTSHDSFMKWNEKQTKQQERSTPSQKWQPPNPGSILINIDASFVAIPSQGRGRLQKDKSLLSDFPGGPSPRQPDEPPNSSTTSELLLCKPIAEPIWRRIDSLEEAAWSAQQVLNTLNPEQAHLEANPNRGPEPGVSFAS